MSFNYKSWYQLNKEQCQSSNQEYYIEHREERKQQMLEYNKQNNEKIKEYKANWRSVNKEKIKNSRQKFVKNNKGKIKAAKAQRRAMILQQTPKWADLKAIEEFYKKCPDGYHVDHIIPLKGKNVRGLHVLENLQYLPALENIKKNNKFS